MEVSILFNIIDSARWLVQSLQQYAHLNRSMKEMESLLKQVCGIPVQPPVRGWDLGYEDDENSFLSSKVQATP
jgi:hypothetical protein